MSKIITSFTCHTTGEGTRLSITYSEISEYGEVINSNIRKSFVVLPISDENNEVLSAVEIINTYLNQKLPTE